MIKITVLGLPGLQRRLNSVSDQIGKKIIRKALRVAMKPVLQEIKSKAPVGPGRTSGKYPHPGGNLRDHIKLSARKYRNRNKFGVQVSTGGGRGISKDDAKLLPFYASFYELGAKGPPGPQPARPFMKPALKANEARILRTVGEEIARGLEGIGK